MTPEQALNFIKSKGEFPDFINWMACWYSDTENYTEVLETATVMYAESLQEI